MPLASGVFHCVATSPPYMGLRDYHGAQEIKWPGMTYSPYLGELALELPSWTGPLGAEPTVEMYVGHLVQVSREVWRVLRNDGTYWLNIGDSYTGSGGAGGDYNPGGSRAGQPKYKGRKLKNLKDGNLIMVPARLALALQADGWIIRRDVIWAKSGTPEPRKGWRYDLPPCDCVKEQREAHIKTQMEEQGIERHRVYDKAGTKFKASQDCPDCFGTGKFLNNERRFYPESWRHTVGHEYVWHLTKQMNYYSDHTRVATETGANPRDVVSPPRTNYSGKHFAVFPPHLVSQFVQASTPRDACQMCGQAYARVVDTGEYWPTCDCSAGPIEIGTPGWVLDPFMGSGTTGLVAKEFGVNYVGLDISFEYLDEQAKLRTGSGAPSGELDDLPLFDE